MTRNTFTPRPSPTPEPVLRPASPKLPAAAPVGAPIVRHKTLPYGIAAIPKLPPTFSSGVHIREERPAFVPPVAVDSAYTDTQRLVALTWMDPQQDAQEMLENAPLPTKAVGLVHRFFPLGIAAGIGFLIAYFL